MPFKIKEHTERANLCISQQTLSQPRGKRGILKPEAVCRLSGLLLAEFSIPKIEMKDLFKADVFCFLGKNKAWQQLHLQIISSRVQGTDQGGFPGAQLKGSASSNTWSPKPQVVHQIDEGSLNGLLHIPPLSHCRIETVSEVWTERTAGPSTDFQSPHARALHILPCPSTLSVKAKTLHLPKAMQQTGILSSLLVCLSSSDAKYISSIF